MGFSEEHGLTPAGQAFLIGYMTRAEPRLAAQAIEHLKMMEADYRGPAPEYWIKTQIP